MDSGKQNREKDGNPYIFPPISLLRRSKSIIDDGEAIRESALCIQQTLLSFGVRAVITDVSRNLHFTRYEVAPEPGVRVSSVVRCADDIKFNLGAGNINIAVIPGKPRIGIDVENSENSIVAIRKIIESKEFRGHQSSLSVIIGIDMYGKAVVTDISDMPHLLIGGCTGSGKTVFLNSMIVGLLYKSRPDDVKFIFIDTKAVNLTLFNGIPHMLIPVVTDIEKSLAALHWAITETIDRYNKFASYGVRNLKSYNLIAEEKHLFPKLPKILIVIDDFSDLMAYDRKGTEVTLYNLARQSGNVGIHIVIATQRPSVDVVTGLVKSCFPGRIAFHVFSSIDSRTILDQKGAEKLLWNGDMLFYLRDCQNAERIQGAYVSDEEICSIVNFLKFQSARNESNNHVEPKISSSGDSMGSFGRDN